MVTGDKEIWCEPNAEVDVCGRPLASRRARPGGVPIKAKRRKERRALQTEVEK